MLSRFRFSWNQLFAISSVWLLSGTARCLATDPLSPTSSPAKEYIYFGGQLVAVDEYAPGVTPATGKTATGVKAESVAAGKSGSGTKAADAGSGSGTLTAATQPVPAAPTLPGPSGKANQSPVAGVKTLPIETMTPAETHAAKSGLSVSTAQ